MRERGAEADRKSSSWSDTVVSLTQYIDDGI